MSPTKSFVRLGRKAWDADRLAAGWPSPDKRSYIQMKFLSSDVQLDNSRALLIVEPHMNQISDCERNQEGSMKNIF